MSNNNLVHACILVGLIVGCGSCDSADPGDDPSNPSRSNPGDNRADGPAASYAQVAEVAKIIYDAVEAGEDVAPYIEGVFEAFGVPVLASSDDVAGAGARLTAGFVTSQMIVRMAEAYREGVLVDVKGFGEGLREQKVDFVFMTGGEDIPLDFFLGQLIYSFVVQSMSEPDVPMDPKSVLPTLVWTLGQERAGRAGKESLDPTWGDEWLDPLQFALLSFTIFSKHTASSSGMSTRALDMSRLTERTKPTSNLGIPAKAVLKELRGELASSLQDVIELPLDVPDATFASVCASLILYGHKATLSNTPAVLWRAPLTPNVTDVELTLTFEDDYENYHKTEALRETLDSINEALGVLGFPWFNCPIPQQGPAAGKSVRWDVAPQLESHGKYDTMESTTDASGKASVPWRTIHDEVTQSCRTIERQREEVGWTKVTLHGLVPGWSTLERAVTALKPDPSWGGYAPLSVRYFKRVTVSDTCHRE